MEKKEITIKQLCKLLKLSDPVTRTHLARFEKYRIPMVQPLTYYYNYSFLCDLKEYFTEKSQSIGKRYQKYSMTVEKLNKVINLYYKKTRANKS